MALGIITRRFNRGAPGRATLIDGVPINIYPGNKYYVDGDLSTGGDGRSWDTAFASIGAAITQAEIDITTAGFASEGPSIFVKARKMTAGSTDPVSYAETVIIPATLPRTKLIGIGEGPAQGNLPQVRKGSGSTALLTIRAPGCVVDGLGFNGASATGGGILLDDDGSTKTAFGTVIQNCHFKNCAGSSATDGRLGGAIQWASAGNAWQVLIRKNRFYKNLSDIVLLGTGGSVPQDVVIEDNIFSGPAASVDVNIYLAAGSGVNGVIIQNNLFTAMPAIGSGSVLRFADLTSCIGSLHNNGFSGAAALTFGAAGDGAKVPTTVFMTQNHDEGGLIARA